MQNTTPPPWHSPVEESEAQRSIQAEIDAIETAAAQQRQEAEARLKAENAKLAAWRAVLARGQAAFANVGNARSQLSVLQRRKVAAEAAFDALAGSWNFTEDFYAVSKADPMVDSPANHCENPFALHARNIVVLNLAIDRLAAAIVGLEKAEADAREAAKAHAAANGLEFCEAEAETTNVASALEPSDEPAATATPGRRKTTK